MKIPFQSLVFVFVLFGFAPIQRCFAQTLHLIIVAQNDSDIGSPKDLVTMKNLAQEIKDNVDGLTVRTLQLNSASASKSVIRNKLFSANIGSNDIVWYYYSGHGKNYDGWPRTDEQKIPLTWVHNQLKDTRARLTLATYDICSWHSPVASPPSDIRPKSTFYGLLFMQAKGNIIMASSAPDQHSYGHPQSGGIFTNSFIDALRANSNWDDVLVDAKRQTASLAREIGKAQVPIYDNQSRMDGPQAAPAYRVRSGETLESIAKAMEEGARAMGHKVKIRVSDIQRWNPGVTNQNLHTFGKLEFNPEDPLLSHNNNLKARFPSFSSESNAFPTPTYILKENIITLIPNSKKEEISIASLCNNLEIVLDSCGFYDRSYFRTDHDDGIAIATRAEQIEEDGSSKEPRVFCSEEGLKSNMPSSWYDYFLRLFYDTPIGRYRMFVFMISTDVYFNQVHSNSIVADLDTIYQQGSKSIISEIEQQVIEIDEYKFHILVYEFQKTSGRKGFELLTSSELPGKKHVRKAGIYQAIHQLNQNK